LGKTLQELLALVVDIDRLYQVNPYHSFRHAVDVTYIVFYMMRSVGLERFLTPLDMATMLLSALCHDLSHPGLNNLYQVNGKTDLAMLYKDQSVLENFSISQALALFRKHRLLEKLEPSGQADQVRRMLTDIILSTDMLFHFDVLKDWNGMFDVLLASGDPKSGLSPVMKRMSLAFRQSRPNSAVLDQAVFSPEQSPSSHGDSPKAIHEAPSPPVDRSSRTTFPDNLSIVIPEAGDASIVIELPLKSPNHRLTVMKTVMHAADISNPCRPWAVCKRWSDRVLEEFFLQGVHFSVLLIGQATPRDAIICR
jgi:hypothetical protein